MVALERYYDGYVEHGILLGMYDRAELESHYSLFVDAMLKHQALSLHHRMLSHIYQVTLAFLKKHDDLILVQADKSMATILMFRSDYISKMDTWLSSYLSSGACIKFTGNKNMLLRRLLALYKRVVLPLRHLYALNPSIYPSNIHKDLLIKLQDPPQISYLYGCIKTHKPDFPIRPICSPINWYIGPLHKLCTYFLTEILGDRLSTHNLKNMDDLTGHLLDLSPIPDYVFVTLDIKEMYPKTPLVPLWQVLENLMSFDWFQANYFSFNSIWYQQLEGLPQGGSASGLLATL
ncbi:uncharacterized protein LOC119672074 [Teleopsis dalmanni]|uniref:uncharacterized protein LOC119672074 n=1 Tax=Teleopsis dalmanni TaxID=139649 RepID=UPI0018CDA675|nr:uncharacterized protein LOC119672074 [Teleopsis dalmanni]